MQEVQSMPELLRRLSEISDPENRDTFLSLYVDSGDPLNSKVLERRLRAITSALEDREHGEAVEKMYHKARNLISNLSGGHRSVAVFLDSENRIEEIRGLGSRIDNALILDASPYILPLARFADEHETFILLLLDGQRASIHLIEDAFAETKSEHEHSAIGRHRKGGWSQMRYQRNREGIVKGFHDQVSERLDNLLDEVGEAKIIIAGPGASKMRFQERMSKRAIESIAMVEDADLSESENQLFERFVGLAKAHEDAEEEEYIDRLRKGLMTGERAITGCEAVITATEEGRVDDLLILENHTIPGMKCEPCVRYMFKQGQTCPICGSDGNEVDLANEAVEAAIRSSSHVEFIDDPFLESIGGIAALLRW